MWPTGERSTSRYLVIHLPLQLNDLVLHAMVELLKVFGRARLDLKLLQLPFGSHPSVSALDDDGGVSGSTVLPPLQPAQHMLLDDGGLVVHHELWAR